MSDDVAFGSDVRVMSDDVAFGSDVRSQSYE